ncbi:MAG: diguanylate cyclase (GGDEF)-like protein [Motiliproteus sp.]|jgi:diguanylate cyclase (GGDEF)-like protein
MKRFLACLALFVCISILGLYWSNSYKQKVHQQQQKHISEIVNIQVSNIERRLSRSLSTTYMLAIEVQQNKGKIDDFESFAQYVIDNIGGVSNLQLAPDGIIEKIHPLPGNEKAIGHNILKDDKRKKEAWLAIESKQLTLAGPFKLVQGGVAIIGRNPVFINKEGKPHFWGFVSALINLKDLLAVTDLDLLEEKGYCYQLTRVHPDTKQIDTIAQSATSLGDISHTAEIQVPSGVWYLKMSHEVPLAFNGLLAYGASFLIAGLASLLVWNMMRYPQHLERVVKNKTLELEDLVFNDYLTGLANRRSLSDRLKQVLKESKRYRRTAALMYLDLDDFKRINDSMGHDAGDALIKQIASRLQGAVRESDLVARLGGDEFSVLLLNQTSVENAAKIAEKLINEIERPVCIKGRCFSISASIGIALVPNDGDDVPTLLRSADLAMYAAKQAGKNSFHFFDQDMQIKAIEKHQLEMDLTDAIINDQLELHYQPIVDMQSREVSSYEALVRWNHPTRGFLLPDGFIGIAEESGKIVDLGYWVIRQVCELISHRTRQQRNCDPIAVNLSPKQFVDPNLMENIRTIVKEADIDARKLEVEITESTLMDNVDDAIQIMEQLRAMGIRIAIDDFGTGYSSLAVIKRFPVDKLKIDRSFVGKLDDDRSDHKIVRAIIAMAHTLQIEVVAEGIETERQYELLKNAKCDVGQGYLFAKPGPADQIFSSIN